jgi:hypothetical protein
MILVIRLFNVPYEMTQNDSYHLDVFRIDDRMRKGQFSNLKRFRSWLDKFPQEKATISDATLDIIERCLQLHPHNEAPAVTARDVLIACANELK